MSLPANIRALILEIAEPGSGGVGRPVWIRSKSRRVMMGVLSGKVTAAIPGCTLAGRLFRDPRTSVLSAQKISPICVFSTAVRAWADSGKSLLAVLTDVSRAVLLKEPGIRRRLACRQGKIRQWRIRRALASAAQDQEVWWCSTLKPIVSVEDGIVNLFGDTPLVDELVEGGLFLSPMFARQFNWLLTYGLPADPT
jgi:hypothetical protein